MKNGTDVSGSTLLTLNVTVISEATTCVHEKIGMTRELKGCLGGSSVQHPTVDLVSGHDLMVRGFEPCIRLCTDSSEPALDSVSPSLSAPRLLTPSLKNK